MIGLGVGRGEDQVFQASHSGFKGESLAEGAPHRLVDELGEVLPDLWGYKLLCLKKILKSTTLEIFSWNLPIQNRI